MVLVVEGTECNYELLGSYVCESAVLRCIHVETVERDVEANAGQRKQEDDDRDTLGQVLDSSGNLSSRNSALVPADQANNIHSIFWSFQDSKAPVSRTLTKGNLKFRETVISQYRSVSTSASGLTL